MNLAFLFLVCFSHPRICLTHQPIILSLSWSHSVPKTWVRFFLSQPHWLSPPSFPPLFGVCRCGCGCVRVWKSLLTSSNLYWGIGHYSEWWLAIPTSASQPWNFLELSHPSSCQGRPRLASKIWWHQAYLSYPGQGSHMDLSLPKQKLCSFSILSKPILPTFLWKYYYIREA